eukprot:TRINITY_DN1156_c0_g1_i5.p1 TRINITY_DN1156_c0_g1~~TRINITY_DN1156_c0_g1_i5.p1  ORF type:complete len:909 (-),score=259.27 TRINITY_DN1156_c0_g1_i5:116-2842(-)
MQPTHNTHHHLSIIQNGELRDYQLHGVTWLLKLFDNGINGILADEMGLGKTLQTITLLGYLKEIRDVQGPHIIITPKSTLSNWMKELTKWCPSLKSFKFHGDKNQRAEMRENVLGKGSKDNFDVLVTSYEIAIKEKAALKKFCWRYLIIDEAHRIKNEKSILSQVVRLYDSQYRLLITGTPLQNNLHELWALLNFLLPDVFSSAEDFDAWFDMTDKENQAEVINRLHKVLKPFLLRRLKSDVEKKLPPKKEIKLFVGMSVMQREWYKNILMKDISSINGATDSKSSKMRLLNIVMQLRKCCNHPYLFVGAEPPPYETGEHLITNSGKLVVLDKLLPKLKEKGSRVLIFSQMTRLLDILEDYLMYRGYEYCRIDGSTEGDTREQAIEDFNKQDSTKFAFLLSTRAGGLGINLATADTVVLYDSDWNPQMDLQAQDRAHRIGQTKPVNVYRFVTENTVEEKVVERAEMKLHLDALVIQQGRLVDQNQGPNKDELLSIIKYGADEIFASKGSTITDEDIDLILSRGQEKTSLLNDKFKSKANNLLNFSLDSSASDNLYEFEGVDFSNITKQATSLQFIEPPKRERKKGTYVVDEYFRNALRVSEPKSKSSSAAPRPPKQPVIHDFQFYPDALYPLLQREAAAWRQKHGIKSPEEEKADGEVAEKKEEEPIEELTPEEQEEKERMLERGFSEWGRKEFQAFVRGNEKFGRRALSLIAAEIGTKTEKEVKEYASAFWKNYKKIHDWERLIKNIEKGESKIARREEMTDALKRKIESYKDPYNQLTFVYDPSSSSTSLSSKSKSYTIDEDRFLAVKTNEIGYGKWEELKAEVRKSWQFRFDWFLKSRTALELNRRVDSLIRLILKEEGSDDGGNHQQSDSSSSRKRKSDIESKSSSKSSSKSKPSDSKKQRTTR